MNQVRGVPELFGQRGDGMFPYGYRPDACRNLEVADEYVGCLSQSSEKWLGSPPVTRDTGNGASRELEILGMVNLCQRRLGSVVYASIPGVWFRNRTGMPLAESALGCNGK